MKWPGVLLYLLYGSWDATPSGAPSGDATPGSESFAPEPWAQTSSWDATPGFETFVAPEPWEDTAAPSSLDDVAPQTPPGGDEEEEEAVRREIAQQAGQRIKKQQRKRRQRIKKTAARQEEVVAPLRRLKQEKVEEKPTVEALDPLIAAVLEQQAVPLDATR